MSALWEFLWSGTLFAAVLAVLCYLMKVIIQSGIQHQFAKRLEEIRSDISRTDRRVDALQSTALSLMSSRQAAIEQKRLASIEAVWSAAVEQRRYNSAVAMLQGVKVENVAEALKVGGEDVEQLKTFAAGLVQAAGLDPMPQPPTVADLHRLFVPPSVWAAFHALRSVNTYAVALLLSMKAGLGPSVLKDIGETNALILEALPGMKKFIDDHPKSAAFFMTQQLEDHLFSQLVLALEFSDADVDSLKRVSRILRTADDQDLAMPIPVPDQFKADPHIQEEVPIK